METRLVGEPLKRVEDPRFITGASRYLDDVKLPGMTHMVIVRSPHAHARILSIDRSAAAAVPGTTPSRRPHGFPLLKFLEPKLPPR